MREIGHFVKRWLLEYLRRGVLPMNLQKLREAEGVLAEGALAQGVTPHRLSKIRGVLPVGRPTNK